MRAVQYQGKVDDPAVGWVFREPYIEDMNSVVNKKFKKKAFKKHSKLESEFKA